MAERIKAQQEILDISAAERQRIGRDLHDSIAQQMAALCLMSGMLWRKLVQKEIVAANDALEIHQLSKRAIDETRNLARGFYPIELERQGFFPAVEELIVNMERMFKLKCEWEFDETVQIDDFEVATHLYRIIQEAAYNSIRHGKAKNLIVRISKIGGDIHLLIKDDGVGIANAKQPMSNEMGLRIMRHRAKIIGAELEIEPAAKGTVLMCRFPQKETWAAEEKTL